jgi:formate C-acetyltransferase
MINVEQFILNNYTPYDGGSSFLSRATPRTKRVLNKVQELLYKEQKNGGVLKIDASRPSSLLSHPPGYIDKADELIVGLQTDEPLKRAISPFSGLRNAIQACKAYGEEIDEEVFDNK